MKPTEQLQLHEIAGYLPHKLPARLSHEGILNLDLEYSTAAYHGLGFIEWFGFYDGEINGSVRLSDKLSYDFDEQSEIEIVLRPMSDIDKKGELHGVYKKWFDHLHAHCSYYSGLPFDVVIALVEKSNIDCLPKYVIDWLLEHHFDIHNLIGRGLAIDINTLKD